MAIETNPENTVYGSYGEFYAEGMADWTEQDWRDYDAFLAAEFADFEESQAEWEIFAAYDDEPPF